MASVASKLNAESSTSKVAVVSSSDVGSLAEEASLQNSAEALTTVHTGACAQAMLPSISNFNENELNLQLEEKAEEVEQRLTEIKAKLIKTEQIIFEINKVIEQNCNNLKMLKKGRNFWQYLFSSSVKHDYDEKKLQFQEIEQNTKKTKQKYKLDAELLTAEITAFEKQLLQINKAQQSIKIKTKIATALKAGTQLEALKQRNSREKVRENTLSYLKDLSHFPYARDAVEIKACHKAHQDAKEAAKEKDPNLTLPQLAQIKASVLEVKTYQTEAAAALLAEAHAEIKDQRQIIEKQRTKLKQLSPWYRCRSRVEKIELKQNTFILKLIKQVDRDIGKEEKITTQEIQRLQKQKEKLNNVVAAITKMKSLPPQHSSNRNKLRFDAKLENLQKEKLDLEADRARTKLCFE